MSVRATNWAWEQGPALQLKQGELLLLVRIGDHADNDGVCWPGTAYLAKYLVCDESTIRRNLARLEAKGLLHRERRVPELGRGRLADSIHLHLPGIVLPGESPGRSETTNRAKGTGPTGQNMPDQPGNSEGAYIENRKEPSGTVTPLTPRKRGGRRKRQSSEPVEVVA